MKMPCYHNLEKYLTEYIEGTGIAADSKGPRFRTLGRKTKQLTRTPLPRVNAYAMIQRRATEAGINTKIGNHVSAPQGSRCI
jgi:hypothetical protein